MEFCEVIWSSAEWHLQMRVLHVWVHAQSCVYLAQVQAVSATFSLPRVTALEYEYRCKQKAGKQLCMQTKSVLNIPY